jgi:hypothetical protein
MADNVTVGGITFATKDLGANTHAVKQVLVDPAGGDAFKSSTPAAATPAVTTGSATVLASNANRKGATIYNPQAGALQLNLAGGNAATTPHKRLAQYESYEVPSGYTGAITGALVSGSGNVNVVEFTS